MVSASAQTWRWYPGDMDIWMGSQINALRTENGSFYPAFWRNDFHYQVVEFQREYNLAEPETVEIAVEGEYGIKINKNYLFGMPTHFTVPKGRQMIRITVMNMQSPPAIWLNGKTIKSDSTWKVTNHATTVPTDTWYENGPLFDTKDKRPSLYKLPVKAYPPLSFRRQRLSISACDDSRFISTKESSRGGLLLLSWSHESMGYIKLCGVKGKGKVRIYYGESEAEAKDRKHSYLKDEVEFRNDTMCDYTFPKSSAMKYALVDCEDGISVKDVIMMKEMKDISSVGRFECNDTLLNHIWNTSIYTLHLTDREVMIEGIKRDRWMWSGDAIQSYLMNYYSFNDAPVVKRTIWALRGKDPVEQHINTILDYTFYWFNSIYDYYLYTGDEGFVKQIYPRMQSLMKWVEGRLDKEGMVQGKKGDWVFVDWSPEKMPKDGQLAFEQMVYCRSLESMALCAGIVGNNGDKQKYEEMSNKLRQQLTPTFWDEDRNAFVHNVKSGEKSGLVTRYANMFAVLYDYAEENQKSYILNKVLLNDSVMRITTPYMRFYELEALCKLGEKQSVMNEMRSYWGGMLKEGATTFWETYDPKETYPARLAMYGHPYGKSLCHAWGASPIYLIGKYFLGVRPTKPGYKEWVAEPCLGDLKWMRGDVPTPNGKIHIEMTRKQIVITADTLGTGTLYYTVKGKRKSVLIPPNQTVKIKI